MRPSRSTAALCAILCAFLLAGECAVAEAACNGKPSDGFRFSIAEGGALNHFVRQGAVSAHIVLQSSPEPRLIVAFPAGNSGALLRFANEDSGMVWGAVENIAIVAQEDGNGRVLCGVGFEVGIEAGAVTVSEADVGSIRFLRKAVDYEKLPPRPAANFHTRDKALRYSRERPDGESSYVLEVEVLHGDLRVEETPRMVADGGTLRLRVTAASGDPLERPAGSDRLLNEQASVDAAPRRALDFLSYESKMLAGSWRFLTYFGRDTLLSLEMLMPVLTPEAVEIGLGSVFERLSPHGEVAHEEEIGEIAVYRNLAAQGRASATPVYDYDMVDDNLMLAPVFARYTRVFGTGRARQFLSQQTTAKERFAAALARNLRLVVEQARPFACEPVARNLVAIKEGLNDGNWRDSEEGLAGGRYPYDVNAVLMPAALHAAAHIVGSGLLDGHTDGLPAKAELERMARVWEADAAAFFRVSVAEDAAAKMLSSYVLTHRVPPVAVPNGDTNFYAVALDEDLRAIPVMHSDVGMDLLFLQRADAQLADIVAALSNPFPAGLATPVGILSANPVFAGTETRSIVTRNHYHGTVAWSWQQAMVLAGLDAQLARSDLSADLRMSLRLARDKTWQAVTAGRGIINSELWSFEVRGGEYEVVPFGQDAGHHTESNAVQLWSTVYLALRP